MAALEKLAEMLAARGSVKAGPIIGCAPINCGACHFACSLRQQTGEFKSGSVLTVNNLKQVPAGFIGTVTFNPVRQESGGSSITRTGENCSKCNEPASTCSHRKF